MKLHERVRRYISDNKLTIKAVGNKTDIEMKRFYRIIAGNSTMSADELEDICQALEVSPDIFFGNEFLETKNIRKNDSKKSEIKEAIS